MHLIFPLRLWNQVSRPLAMKKEGIQTRKRKPKNQSAPTQESKPGKWMGRLSHSFSSLFVEDEEQKRRRNHSFPSLTHLQHSCIILMDRCLRQDRRLLRSQLLRQQPCEDQQPLSWIPSSTEWILTTMSHNPRIVRRDPSLRPSLPPPLT